MVSTGEKLEAADKAIEHVNQPHSEEEHSKEHTCSEEATEEDGLVNSSCFCIHCSENPCFVDLMFDDAKAHCDCLGEEWDHPLSMAW